MALDPSVSPRGDGGILGSGFAPPGVMSPPPTSGERWGRLTSLAAEGATGSEALSPTIDAAMASLHRRAAADDRSASTNMGRETL